MTARRLLECARSAVASCRRVTCAPALGPGIGPQPATRVTGAAAPCGISGRALLRAPPVPVCTAPGAGAPPPGASATPGIARRPRGLRHCKMPRDRCPRVGAEACCPPLRPRPGGRRCSNTAIRRRAFVTLVCSNHDAGAGAIGQGCRTGRAVHPRPRPPAACPLQLSTGLASSWNMQTAPPPAGGAPVAAPAERGPARMPAAPERAMPIPSPRGPLSPAPARGRRHARRTSALPPRHAGCGRLVRADWAVQPGRRPPAVQAARAGGCPAGMRYVLPYHGGGRR